MSHKYYEADIIITEQNNIIYKHKHVGIIFLNQHNHKYLAKLDDRIISQGLCNQLAAALNELNKE